MLNLVCQGNVVSDIIKKSTSLAQIPVGKENNKEFAQRIESTKSLKVLVATARLLEASIYPQEAENAHISDQYDQRYWMIVKRISQLPKSHDSLKYLSLTKKDGSGSMIFRDLLEKSADPSKTDTKTPTTTP